MKGLGETGTRLQGEAACRWDPSGRDDWLPQRVRKYDIHRIGFQSYLLTSNHMKVTEKVALICSRHNVDIGW
jgi:hypothetical protein